MGIRGLESFVERNCPLPTVKIAGDLVIDGNGLLFFLKGCLEEQGGQGSHRSFHEVVLKFFATLRDRGIKPMVIFDGLQDRKREVQIERYSQQLSIDCTAQEREHAQGPGWWTVGCGIMLKEILLHSSDINFEFFVAEGEADHEIARYAHSHRCPVLARDSDFYIFDLPQGYIQFKSFQWTHHVDGGVMADVFYFDNFSRRTNFPSQHRLLLPAILGNDQIKPTPYSKPKAVIWFARSCRQYWSFDSLLSALEEGDVHAAIPGGLTQEQLLDNCRKARLFYCLDRGIPSASLEFPVLPPWAKEQYRKGRFHKSVVQALAFKFCFPPLPAEDFRRGDTALSVSRKIRAHTYGILLGPEKVVQEAVRAPCEARVIPTPVTTYILYPPVPLDSIERMTVEERKGVLCDILSCEAKTIIGLQPDRQLIAAATQFWCRETNPELPTVNAIVACIIYCGSGKAAALRQPRISYDFYLKVLQALAQWQQVYYDTLSLNQVLKEPFQKQDLVRFFDGDIVLCFASDIHVEHTIASLFDQEAAKDFSKFASIIRKV